MQLLGEAAHALGGHVEIAAPAVAEDTELVLPEAEGTARRAGGRKGVGGGEGMGMHLARIQGKGAQTPQRGKSERCDGLMADAHMCRRPRRKLGSQHAPLSPFRIPPQHSGSAPARCGALGLRAKCCSCECSGKFQSKRGRFKVCKGLRKGVVVGRPRSGNRSDASSSDVHTCCIVADPHCCPEVPGSATIGDGAPKPFVCPFGVLMWLWYGPAGSGGRATCAAAGASMVQRVKRGCRLNRSLSINRASSDAAGRSRFHRVPWAAGWRRLWLVLLDPILTYLGLC